MDAWTIALQPSPDYLISQPYCRLEIRWRIHAVEAYLNLAHTLRSMGFHYKFLQRTSGMTQLMWEFAAFSSHPPATSINDKDSEWWECRKFSHKLGRQKCFYFKSKCIKVLGHFCSTVDLVTFIILRWRFPLRLMPICLIQRQGWVLTSPPDFGPQFAKLQTMSKATAVIFGSFIHYVVKGGTILFYYLINVLSPSRCQFSVKDRLLPEGPPTNTLTQLTLLATWNYSQIYLISLVFIRCCC